MFESFAMATPKRSLLVLLACLLLLDGCAKSRVVQRDYPTESSQSRARAVRSPPRMSRAEPTPIPQGATHVVSRGETLYGISFRFGLRYQDVAAWNGISEPYVIEVGQRLRLRPPMAQAIAARPIVSPPPAPRAILPVPAPAAATANANATPVPPIASPTPTPTPTPVPATPVARPPVASPPPVRATDPAITSTTGVPTWQWPARGPIIGRYVVGDQTKQGINIAGTAGQSVTAAADGVVVYSGAGLVGYGELIIIKHSDEWLSAYAHNRRRLAAEGARVKAGDTIAEMGRTGATRDMLHFEIRRNGKPVDPLVFLPRH
jgi:lipoprotein NlpD